MDASWVLWILLFLAFFVVSFCMIGLILLQEGKGGGLTGNAGGMDAVMGARNPLRRWTAYFFVAFILLAVGINFFFYKSSESRKVLGNWQYEEAPAGLPPVNIDVDDPAAAAATLDPAAAPAIPTTESAAPAATIVGDDAPVTAPAPAVPATPAAPAAASAEAVEAEAPATTPVAVPAAPAEAAPATQE